MHLHICTRVFCFGGWGRSFLATQLLGGPQAAEEHPAGCPELHPNGVPGQRGHDGCGSTSRSPVVRCATVASYRVDNASLMNYG